MVAPWIMPAITGGAGIIGSLVRGSGPEWRPDRANRQAQEDQRARYQAMSEGRGPSLGRMALQQGLQQGANQQQAMAASARGGPLQQRMAQRQAQMTGAQMAGRASQAAAQMRAQEQMAAMGQVDRSLAEAEARKLRDYQIARGEFEGGSEHLGNVFGAIGDVGRIPGMLGGGSGGGNANSWKLKK